MQGGIGAVIDARRTATHLTSQADAEFESTLRSVGGTPPQPSPEEFRSGDATGRTIARYHDRKLHADARSNRTFGSLEAATAYARSLGVPAAVIEENGSYATYRIHVDRRLFQGNFSRENAEIAGQADATNVQSEHPGLRTLVTTDDFIIRLNGTGTAALDRIGSPLGPFSSHIQAFGPGLERIADRGRFERQFEQAMRDTAFQALDDSRRAAQDVRSRLDREDLSSQDRAAVNRVLERLRPLDRQIDAKQREVDGAYWNFIGSTYGQALSKGMSGPAIKAQLQAYDTLKLRQAELAQLKAQRADAARDFPLLLRIDDLDQFRAMKPRDQIAALRSAADQVLRDIATTRSNIDNGAFNLWMMDGIRNTTAAGLGVTGERLHWVEDRATGERRTDAAWKIGEGLLTVGLAFGGAFFTGGLSLTLLGASAALGIHSAAGLTSEYIHNGAAANTDLDPNAGLIPQEAVGHWGFVAAAWIGVGLDVAAVGGAIRALRAGQSLASAAKTLGVSEDALRATIRAAELNDFRASVLETEAFSARFGSDAADAVTLLRPNGRGGFAAEIVTRGGIGRQAQEAAVREEMAHLQQLADPALTAHFRRLSEDRLARWPQMSSTDKMEALRSQLTLEKDVQQRILLQQGRAPTETERVALDGYEKQLREIEQGLRHDRPPAWLANAQPPRLFSRRFTETNAAAEAAHYPPPPDGQYYRRIGEDYELVRFDPRSKRWVNPETNPPLRVVRDGDQLGLGPAGQRMTAEQIRAEFELRYSELTANVPLENAFNAAKLSAYQRAYARHYERVFAELDAHGIQPAAVLGGIAGKTDAVSGQFIRQNLRTATIAAIYNAPATERGVMLTRFLRLQPSNGDRGELFSQFRSASLPSSISAVDFGTNSTTLAGMARRADGAVNVERRLPRSPAPGTYLAEDKAGAGAFRLDQARRYSEALTASGGRIAAQNGQQYDGVVYFFSNFANARAARSQIRALHPNIHMAYYDELGTLRWLSRQ